MAKSIALTLSGGGIRAMAFHAGVLRYLATQKKIESVRNISSVSGGSLLIGLLFSLNNYRWPTAEEYQEQGYPALRQILTTTNLGRRSFLSLIINPFNWCNILSRANVLAKTIGSVWGVKGSLADLPEVPIWSANGTTVETGRRFRFKRDACGDYEAGYTSSAEFEISEAMAASAAYPIAIGPFSIRTNDRKWYAQDAWTDMPDLSKPKNAPYKKLHVIDGGIYDNLGLEPYFDVGTRDLKDGIEYLMVSDAGSPLLRSEIPFILTKKRVTRIVEITTDQTRALRIRVFINYIQNNPNNGAYLQIGSDPREVANRHEGRIDKAKLKLHDWMANEDIKKVKNYPTNLSRITEDDFNMIAKHGYETAEWNDLFFGQE